MRPENLRTKIFLDSGDPAETRAVLSVLGFLDGQTTNPSLIAKNPALLRKRFSQNELLEFYKIVVQEVSSLIPEGSISIEVYANASTPAENMLAQAREFYQWIPNAHIKYPTTPEGLKAAQISVKEGMRVNLTLVFSQSQAAAVYAATRGAKKGQVFVSPFVGRLDDIGQRGMDLIANIIKMYKAGDDHVEILTASVRSVAHLQEAILLGSDIITAPLTELKDWQAQSANGLDKLATSKTPNPHLKPIPYQNFDLNKNWQEYNNFHELTDRGLARFADDWNSLIAFRLPGE